MAHRGHMQREWERLHLSPVRPSDQSLRVNSIVGQRMTLRAMCVCDEPISSRTKPITMKFQILLDIQTKIKALGTKL